MTQQINLYEARLRPRHEWATSRHVGVATGAVLVLMVSFALGARVTAERQLEAASALQQQLVDSQGKLSALNKAAGQNSISPSIAADLDIARAMLAARKEVITVLESGKLGNTSGFSSLLTGFARQAQNGLWLTGIAISAGGDEIEIRGRLLDSARLPAYVQLLSQEPVFRGRRFAALEVRNAVADEQGGVVAAGRPTDADLASVVKPARYFEFVLRSENGGAPARKEVRP